MRCGIVFDVCVLKNANPFFTFFHLFSFWISFLFSNHFFHFFHFLDFGYLKLDAESKVEGVKTERSHHLLFVDGWGSQSIMCFC